MEAQISEILKLTLSSFALKNYSAGHMALPQTDTHLENLNGPVTQVAGWLAEFLLPTYLAAIYHPKPQGPCPGTPWARFPVRLSMKSHG